MPPLIEDEDDAPLTQVQDDYAARAANKSGISGLLNRIKSIFDIFDPSTNQQATENLTVTAPTERKEAADVIGDTGGNVVEEPMQVDETNISVDEQIEPQDPEPPVAPTVSNAELSHAWNHDALID